MVNNLVAINGSIYSGPLTQRNGTGFGKEAHKSQIHAMQLFEFIFMRFADGHNLRHIYFIKSSEQGRLLLRGYEGYEAPPELAAVPVIGARVFTQDGKKIAQYRVARHESVAWEFRASDFGVEVPTEGQIIEKNGWVAVVRPSGEQCSVIAFRGSKAEMQAFLEALPKP